ncbi:MAG: selenocysteine-specific translation elongation factor [Planctomycetes bacterium]|nr:selenocysteine-specific translation elongation factor [Planctomycetota bacterium]
MAGRDNNRVIHAVVAGTAGHIDHGKSSLVRALTGVDPDRLKEEKERGMTIDLGFAPLALADGRWMGIVDVPGHERFVRNMVAGCTALDLAMLVVAADDGVMPQTIEHIDILDLLGVRRGLVALTKIDMVDAETAAMAEADVREHLKGTSLEGFDIVRVSTVTGEGMETFRARLGAIAMATPARSHDGAFRMAIQRVFVLKGIGTVVTGIPVSGSIGLGEEVEFLPGGTRAKVRAIQAYGGPIQRAVAGHSTALSVPDAKEQGLHRGMVAAEPGRYVAGRVVDLALRVPPRARPLQHRMSVRFHCGTVEMQGEVLLLDRDRAEPGSEVVARVELAEPVCCVAGDPFLLRLQTPVLTLGGGRVLRCVEQVPGRYRRAALAAELARLRAAAGDVAGRLREEVVQAGGAGRTLAELAGSLGLDTTQVLQLAGADGELFVHARQARVFPRPTLAHGRAELFAAVERMLRDRPLQASIARSALQPSRTLPASLLALVLDELHKEGRIRSTGNGRLLFLDRLKPLPQAEQANLNRLVKACETAGFRPPTLGELAQALHLAETSVQGLVPRAIDEGLVEAVGEHFYAGTTVARVLRLIHANCVRHGGELDIPELRDGIGTSRKYLIPLLEHVDALGMTRLRGGVRILLASSPLAQEISAELGAAGGG